MSGKIFCPNCGSEEVEMLDDANSKLYQCIDCGFHGKIFPEKTLIGEASELDDEEEMPVIKAVKTKTVKKKVSKKSKGKKK